MVKSCIAFGCTNRFDKSKNIHFHRFPLENKDLCSRWVASTKREHFTPSKYSHICSEHFEPSDYVSSQHDLKPRLKPQSVPSIFQFPERLQPKKKQRKLPVKRSLPEDEQNENPSTSASFSSDTLSPPPAKKQKVTDSPTKLKLKRKIKTLQQKLRRKEKKISSMKEMMTELQDKQLLTQM